MRVPRPPQNRPNSRRLILLLVAVGTILYANTLPNQMFWDDFDNILNNQFIQNWRYFPKLFTENIIAGAGLMSNYWRPMLMATFSLEWHLWGNWAPGYHFINAALHIANAVLLFCILSRLLRSRNHNRSSEKNHSDKSLRFGESAGTYCWLAFLTSLIFLVHPAQTEAVTYVSSLADPLSTLFIFSGIFLYLKYRTLCTEMASDDHPRGGLESPLYLLSLIAYCLALMTKEAAIVMPAFIFIIDLLFLNADSRTKERLRKAAGRLWPFLIIAAIYILLRATVLNFGGTFNLYEGKANVFTENFHVRLFTFFRVLVEYFKIIFWPADLHAERTVAIATSLLHPDVITGGLILTGFLAAAFTQLRHFPILSFGLLWFLIGLAPVSNIAVPINNLIMEHWLYLPIIGIALIFVRLGMSIAEKWAYLRMPLLGLFAVALTLLSIKTIDRNRDWRDPITFYNHTLQYAPNSYRIINNLGMAYADTGDHAQAEETYRRAIKVEPSNPVAYHNLGNTYKETGERELAIENFQTAIQLDPEFIFSYNALANLYLEEGDYRGARTVFEKYLDHSASKVDTLFLLAQIAVEERDLEGALSYLEEALAIDPENQTIQAAIAQLENLVGPGE